MRPKIAPGEFYHVYNRGVDKRIIFEDDQDCFRFLQSMREFNVLEPIGSLYHNRQNRRCPTPPIEERLVRFVAYCLNPNHFHFILEETREGGVSEFMKRLAGGYTNYFNDKYLRSGALFQGKYKYKHIENDSYLRHLSVYVNLNHQIHGYLDWEPFSSFNQYIGAADKYRYSVENKEIVLGFWANKREYENFAHEMLPDIRSSKIGGVQHLRFDEE